MIRRGPTRVPTSGVEWGNRLIERCGKGKLRLYRQNSADLLITNEDGSKRRVMVGPEKGCADLTGNDTVTGVRIEIECKLPGDTRSPEQIGWGNRMVAQHAIYLLSVYDAKLSLVENLGVTEEALGLVVSASRARLGHLIRFPGGGGMLEFESAPGVGYTGVRGEGLYNGFPWSFRWSGGAMTTELVLPDMRRARTSPTDHFNILDQPLAEARWRIPNELAHIRNEG